MLYRINITPFYLFRRSYSSIHLLVRRSFRRRLLCFSCSSVSFHLLRSFTLITSFRQFLRSFIISLLRLFICSFACLLVRSFLHLFVLPEIVHPLVYICLLHLYFLQQKDPGSRQAVMKINTNRKDALPIIDAAPTHIGESEEPFRLEIGPVCFMY